MEKLRNISSQFQTLYAEDGSKITVKLSRKNRTKPGPVSIHEGAHTVVGEKSGSEALKATKIPRGKALGETHLNNMNLIAAAAPYVLGLDGTSSDMQKVYMFSSNPNRVIEQARSIALQNMDEIMEVAAKIEEDGTIERPVIQQAMAGEFIVYDAKVTRQNPQTGKEEFFEFQTKKPDEVIYEAKNTSIKNIKKLPLAA